MTLGSEFAVGLPFIVKSMHVQSLSPFLSFAGSLTLRITHIKSILHPKRSCLLFCCPSWIAATFYLFN